MKTESIVQFISTRDWLERWAGSYTFISCWYWGRQYDQALKRVFGLRYTETLFFHRQGAVECYSLQSELDAVGAALANFCAQHPDTAKERCVLLEERTDAIRHAMAKLNQAITPENFEQFYRCFEDYLPYHVFVKYTVDYFSQETSALLLSRFTQARLYAEEVYSETEATFRNFLSSIAKRANYRVGSVTCLTGEELAAYFKTNVLPPAAILDSRYEGSVIYYHDSASEIFVGAESQAIARALFAGASDLSEVRGTTAFPGVATGRVRIVLDPFNPGEFNTGDILVAGMTRPEYLPLIKRASAIVTDAGGILCHAAISARELKIPCVVGTRVATKVFRVGDTLTVDATEGTVKKET